MANRERLALAPEDHLLMCDQARKPHGVNRVVDVAPSIANQLGGALRGARGSIELAFVVQLDYLALGHVPSGLARHLHHQHRSDREVGRHEHPCPLSVARRRLGLGMHRVELEPGCANDGVDIGGETLADVRGGRLRRREVHHHVRLLQKVGQRSLERRVCPASELEVAGLLDGLAHRLSHAPRRPRYNDADQPQA